MIKQHVSVSACLALTLSMAIAAGSAMRAWAQAPADAPAAAAGSEVGIEKIAPENSVFLLGVKNTNTMIERFKRTSVGRMELAITIDDPKAYTEPWTVTLKQRIVVDTELIDEICLENEKFEEFVERIKR